MQHMTQMQRGELKAFAERVRALELGPSGRRRAVHGRAARVAQPVHALMGEEGERGGGGTRVAK